METGRTSRSLLFCCGKALFARSACGHDIAERAPGPDDAERIAGHQDQARRLVLGPDHGGARIDHGHVPHPQSRARPARNLHDDLVAVSDMLEETEVRVSMRRDDRRARRPGDGAARRVAGSERQGAAAHAGEDDKIDDALVAALKAEWSEAKATRERSERRLAELEGMERDLQADQAEIEALVAQWKSWASVLKLAAGWPGPGGERTRRGPRPGAPDPQEGPGQHHRGHAAARGSARLGLHRGRGAPTSIARSR
jgi:hypothetical protein